MNHCYLLNKKARTKLWGGASKVLNHVMTNWRAKPWNPTDSGRHNILLEPMGAWKYFFLNSPTHFSSGTLLNWATELFYLGKSIHTASTWYNRRFIHKSNIKKRLLFFSSIVSSNKNHIQLPDTFKFSIPLPREPLDAFDKQIFNALLRMAQWIDKSKFGFSQYFLFF